MPTINLLTKFKSTFELIAICLSINLISFNLAKAETINIDPNSKDVTELMIFLDTGSLEVNLRTYEEYKNILNDLYYFCNESNNAIATIILQSATQTTPITTNMRVMDNLRKHIITNNAVVTTSSYKKNQASGARKNPKSQTPVSCGNLIGQLLAP